MAFFGTTMGLATLKSYLTRSLAPSLGPFRAEEAATGRPWDGSSRLGKHFYSNSPETEKSVIFFTLLKVRISPQFGAAYVTHGSGPLG